MQSRLSRGKFEGSHKGYVPYFYHTALHSLANTVHVCRPVRCLDCDGLSQTIVSGGVDGKLILSTVKTQKVLRAFKLSAGVSYVRVHRESAMAAVALDDFTLCIVDLETKGIVRKFPGQALPHSHALY